MGGVLPVPYRLLKTALFQLDPERAHHMAQAWIRRAGSTRRRVERMRARTLSETDRKVLRTDALGLTFDSPVGLGAGFDKGEVLGGGLFALGYGFVEIGTITPRPQAGNPRPRLFRLKSEHALINRMGFNNAGAPETAARLEEWPVGTRVGPVGINIGKNKDTPLKRATEDYQNALEALLPHADYVVVNVSSPNTPGLRKLQEPERLKKILGTVTAEAGSTPVLVKIDPDQELEAVDQACDVAADAGCRGVIATNTTVSRTGVRDAQADEAGGLSGRPLRTRALEVLRRVHARVGSELVCVGVGGIDSVDAAWERICAGARLIQVYTGMIYEGPELISTLNRGLAVRAREAGYERIADAVGCS